MKIQLTVVMDVETDLDGRSTLREIEREAIQWAKGTFRLKQPPTFDRRTGAGLGYVQPPYLRNLEVEAEVLS